MTPHDTTRTIAAANRAPVVVTSRSGTPVNATLIRWCGRRSDGRPRRDARVRFASGRQATVALEQIVALADPNPHQEVTT